MITLVFIGFVKSQHVSDKNFQQTRTKKEPPQPHNGYF